jgi:hypothetical protein
VKTCVGIVEDQEKGKIRNVVGMEVPRKNESQLKFVVVDLQ